MSGILARVLNVAAGALVLCAPLPLSAASPVASESFRIGTAGALCEAQGVMLGDARNTLFDRKWALICADVDRPVGAAYSWKGSPTPTDRVGIGRDVALDCGGGRCFGGGHARTFLRESAVIADVLGGGGTIAVTEDCERPGPSAALSVSTLRSALALTHAAADRTQCGI